MHLKTILNILEKKTKINFKVKFRQSDSQSKIS